MRCSGFSGVRRRYTVASNGARLMAIRRSEGEWEEDGANEDENVCSR